MAREDHLRLFEKFICWLCSRTQAKLISPEKSPPTLWLPRSVESKSNLSQQTFSQSVHTDVNMRATQI